jgi:hypothetical protein
MTNPDETTFRCDEAPLAQVVHIHCGRKPSECDCPASIRRPMRCRVVSLEEFQAAAQRVLRSTNTKDA